MAEFSSLALVFDLSDPFYSQMLYYCMDQSVCADKEEKKRPADRLRRFVWPKLRGHRPFYDSRPV